MPKQQQQSSAFLECTFACHPSGICGDSQKTYPRPSLRNCRGRTCLRTFLLPFPNKRSGSGYWTTWSCSPVLPDHSSSLLLLVGSPQRRGLDLPLAQCPLSSGSSFQFSTSMGGKKEIYMATSLVQETCCTLKKQRILFFWVLSLSVFHDLKFHSQRTSLKAF